MKVTVCFGSTRIVVPVGDGNITVAQLTDKSLTRYRKLAKKDPAEAVTVHHLHSIADDGILDLDDVVADVVDDRDVLVAVFEEETPNIPPPLPDTKHLLAQAAVSGDKGGSSAAESDLSTQPKAWINDSDYYSNMSQDRERIAWIDKWVQEVDPQASSPAPHASPTMQGGGDEGGPSNNSSRSSHQSPRSSQLSSERPKLDHTALDGRSGGKSSSERGIDAPRGFSERGIDAPKGFAERGSEVRNSSERGIETGNSKVSSERAVGSKHGSGRSTERGIDRGIERGVERGLERGVERGVEAPSAFTERAIDAGPQGNERGIGVPQAFADERGMETAGGEVQYSERGIEVGKESGERTVEYSRSDTITTSNEPETLRVEIVRDAHPLGCNVQHVNGASPGLYITSIEPGSPAELHGQLHMGDKITDINGVNLTSIPIVSVMDVFDEMSSTASVRLTVQRYTPSNNITKDKSPEIESDSGQKTKDTFEIILVKGVKGLGFTIATRENTASIGFSPIFVKTVHLHGAAAVDGRMKPNDILLKVNSHSVVGMPQNAVVSMMRSLSGQVSLSLRRPNSDLPAPLPAPSNLPLAPVPRPAPSRKQTPPPPSFHSSRTRLSLDIALVAPNGRPVGLGISVKGKSMSSKKEPRQDYGIFIKTILKGGAADLDSRLKAGDQLLGADGQALTGLSNKAAMQVLKQSLEKAGKLSSLNIVVSRKDSLNLSADSRTSKPYSSFKDTHYVGPSNSSLSSDPSKYRAMSLSSPNLGRKKKHEMEGNRGVAFSEDIQTIQQNAGDVLESDEDVVFVGQLGEQADPFNRESIFRKSMKKIDQKPISLQGNLRRASSHDSLARKGDTPTPTIIKRGISQESIFSGKDTDPFYESISEETLRALKMNESFQNAVHNSKVRVPSSTSEAEVEEKPKNKGFLNFFSKKNGKKKDDVAPSPKENRSSSEQKPARKDWEPRQMSTPHLTSEWDSRRKPRPDSEREHPRAPAPRERDHRGAHPLRGTEPDSGNHKRSKSSDFFRDKELADRNGLGYIEHAGPRELRPFMSRDHSRDSDRNSGRSNHSARSRDRPRDYSQYPRDQMRPDGSHDHGVAREGSRDHGVVVRDTRDKRYMDTVNLGNFRYGRGSGGHGTPPPPAYYREHGYSPPLEPARYTGSSPALNRPRDIRPSYSPMIPAPISHLQGRRSTEQLSDV